jgi:hypothetical protein
MEGQLSSSVSASSGYSDLSSVSAAFHATGILLLRPRLPRLPPTTPGAGRRSKNEKRRRLNRVGLCVSEDSPRRTQVRRRPLRTARFQRDRRAGQIPSATRFRADNPCVYRRGTNLRDRRSSIRLWPPLTDRPRNGSRRAQQISAIFSTRHGCPNIFQRNMFKNHVNNKNPFALPIPCQLEPRARRRRSNPQDGRSSIRQWLRLVDRRRNRRRRGAQFRAI